MQYFFDDPVIAGEYPTVIVSQLREQVCYLAGFRIWQDVFLKDYRVLNCGNPVAVNLKRHLALTFVLK